jgi:preprotein translocase subunit SecA
MYVIQIPTNRPVIREDLADLVYATEKGKYTAIVNTIKEIHKKGQPILVGTISVEKNELLGQLLDKEHLPHEILNAKNHAREAEIISHAGEKGAITIATNMAGRGTDIKLGVGVKELGGLYVIGTERHESRRIDNQLRGRSGRQGDPGTSQFFVSFEDDLMRRFGTEKIKNMLISLGISETEAIRSKTFTRSIESAQKKVEGNNYDMRKNLLDYDNVMNSQREIIYRRRNELIDTENVNDIIYAIFESHVAALVDDHIPPEGYLTASDVDDILEEVNNNLLKNKKITVNELDVKNPDAVIDYIVKTIKEDYQNKLKDIPTGVVNEFEKAITLRVIDSAWVEHISTMEQLREGIGLRGYGQMNPLQAYTEEGFNLFDKLQDSIDAKVSMYLLKAEINKNVERKQTIKGEENNSDETVKNTPVHVKKVGRNDPCPCGSGLKYKNCCGRNK